MSHPIKFTVTVSKGKVVYSEEIKKIFKIYSSNIEIVKSVAQPVIKSNKSLTKFLKRIRSGLNIYYYEDNLVIKRTYNYDNNLHVLNDKVKKFDGLQSVEKIPFAQNETKEIFLNSIWDVGDIVRNAIVFDYFAPKFLDPEKQLAGELLRATFEDTCHWCFECEYSDSEYNVYVQKYSHVSPVNSSIVGLFDKVITFVITGFKKDIIGYLSDNKISSQHSFIFIVRDIWVEDFKEITALLFDPEQYYTLPTEVIYWKSHDFVFAVYFLFLEYPEYLDSVLNVGTEKSLKFIQSISAEMLVGESHDLKVSLREMEDSNGSAFEGWAKSFLTYCFKKDFIQYNLQEQSSINKGSQKTDFQIDTWSCHHAFIQQLVQTRNCEKLLFEAKNYSKQLANSDLSRLRDYLSKSCYGNFAVVLSRKGHINSDELLTYYRQNNQVILVLDENDLIKLIEYRENGSSSFDYLAELYSRFISQ